MIDTYTYTFSSSLMEWMLSFASSRLLRGFHHVPRENRLEVADDGRSFRRRIDVILERRACNVEIWLAGWTSRQSY